MRALILCLLLANISCSRTETRTEISVKYEGSHDKPLPVLLFANFDIKTNEVFFEKKIIVQTHVINLIESEADMCDLYKSEADYFKITIKKNNSTLIRYLNSFTKSQAFLSRLEEILTRNHVNDGKVEIKILKQGIWE